MKKQTNKTADQYGLEGDGIIENFFHLLWTKDPLFGTIPSVYVPHTVVIKYSQPMSWYFMKDGALKKKTKKNLTVDHIKEVFLKNKTPAGVVAVFMRYTPDDKGEDTKVIFEYFDEKEFLTFINDKWTMNHGILQQFIQPKGDNNYLIRANWSPKLCLFEKVESVSKINDKKLDIYDRVLTFEAENFHSRERPLRGYVLPNKIQRICANISQHVQNVSFESILIARMILHFKVDENSRIWLLLCTSLRIDQGDDEDKVLIKQKVRGEEIVMNYKPEDYLSKIGISDNIRTDIIKGKPVNMHKIYTCTNCAKHIEPNLVAEATYKTIIEGYEWDHLREKDRSKENAVIKANPDNLEEMLEKLMRRANHSEHAHTKIVDEKVTSLVPPLIKKIYPRLKDEMYKTLKNDVAFLKKTALFCEDCILHIQQSNEENLKSQKHNNDFYGTGRLKPESLKFRHVHTMKNIQVNRPHTNNNFFKFRSPSDTRNMMHSARHSHVRNQSDLPILFGDVKSIKTIKTLNSENDEVIDSGAESGDEGTTSRRRTPIMMKTSLRINPANLALDSIKTQKFPKQTPRTVNSSPFRSNFPLLSSVTSRPSMLAEELVKRENLLTARAGLGYASATSRKSSQGGFSKENLGTTQTTQYTTLTHTLDAYMPKMRFLKSDYESLRGNFISPSKGSDTLEKVFEEENKKGPLAQTVKKSVKKNIKMKSVDLRGAYKHVIDI